MDELRDSAEMTATIEELHIGVVDLQIIEEISSEEATEIPYWGLCSKVSDDGP
jgi:hypothetical protein